MDLFILFYYYYYYSFSDRHVCHVQDIKAETFKWEHFPVSFKELRGVVGGGVFSAPFQFPLMHTSQTRAVNRSASSHYPVAADFQAPKHIRSPAGIRVNKQVNRL